MRRLQFGHGEAGVRAAVSKSSSFVAPTFGTRCICCNVDAKGRTERYQPSARTARANAFDVPVCVECAMHAIDRALPAGQISMCVIGVVVVAWAIIALRGDGIRGTVLIIGLAISAISIARLALTRRRQRTDHLDAGHHPGLTFVVGHGVVLVETSNDDLTNQLLANQQPATSPRAQELATPPVWRELGHGAIARAEIRP